MADKNRYIRARERAGLSVAQAARHVGVSVDDLTIVEGAQQPSRAITVTRLADLYGCSVEWLTGQVPYHPVPCFSFSFEERKEIATYLPMACPICGRLRLELIDGGKVVRCEKCTTSSEWDGFTVKRYAEVADEMRSLAAEDKERSE